MRQIVQVFEAQQDRLTREHNDRAWLAYHVAVLVRNKTVTPLRRLQAKPRNRKPQTPQQQIEIAKLWVAALGGKVIDKRKAH